MSLMPNLRGIFKENLNRVAISPKLERVRPDPKFLGVIEDPNAELPSGSEADMIVVRSKYKPTYEILIWDFDSVFKKEGWIFAGEAKSKEEAVKSAQENMLTEKRGGESFGKTLQDIATHHKVDIKELEKQLEKGIGIEGEHGEDASMAKKVAMDHLWENPKYYTKLVSCGLEEPIEEGLLGSLGNAAVGAVKGAVAGATGNKPGQNQGQDPSQMDPNVYKKYQAENDKLAKQKDVLTKQLQKLNQDKAALAKKYNVNPNA